MEARLPAMIETIKNHGGRVGAAKAVSISYDTFLKWMKEFPEFSESIIKAEIEQEQAVRTIAIQSIMKQMPDNWQAAAWWLERKYKSEFGRNLDITSGQEQIAEVMNRPHGLRVRKPTPPVSQ